MVIIDKVYLINLDRRPDRLENMKKKLKDMGGIFNNFNRFQAIDGNNITDDQILNLCSTNTINSLKNKFHLHADIRSKAGIGCYLSHYNVWLDIIKNNYNNVLILEDDTFTDLSYKEIMQYIDTLPEDYDIAFLSYYNFNKTISPTTHVNQKWIKSDGYTFYNMDSYIISNKGAKLFVEKALPISNQVDSYINVLCSLNKNIKRYFSSNILFFQNRAEYGTDIQDICKICDLNKYADFSSSDIEFLENVKAIYGIETFEQLMQMENFDILNNNLILPEVKQTIQSPACPVLQESFFNNSKYFTLLTIIIAFIMFLGSVIYINKKQKE